MPEGQAGGKPLKGKQELRLTFEFIDHDDPDKKQKNTLEWIDTREAIGAIQAVAIQPGFTLMSERFQLMQAQKAIKENPAFADFLTSLSS